MGRILCIETATTNCSVALGQDGITVAVREDYENKYSHAERLHTFIEEILQEADWTRKSLDAIAVSQGPGSYTGLRIGVSSAKGLAYSLDLPLIAVDTLEALAYQVQDEPLDVVIPLLDARRMEVYTATFSNKEINRLSGTEAKILNENSFQDVLEKEKVGFIGNGVKKFREVCKHPEAVFFENRLPSAREMVVLAQRKLELRQFEDVAYFEPFYLKDFIAGGQKKE